MLNNLFLESGYFTAICLAAVIFVMPLFSRELRKSGSILFGYLFVVFLHQVVAFLNDYFFRAGGGSGGTFGAGNDANRSFHLISKELALQGEMWYRGQSISIPLSMGSLLKGDGFYYEMLGTVYKWFGSSLLLGEQLSILVFALSCIVFLKINRQLGLERYSFSSLVCFGSLPSMVLLGAITLRESYQLFFFMLTVNFGIRISMGKKINIGSAFLMVISALLMAVFHKALAVYAIGLFLLFLIWSLRPISRFGNIKKLHLIAMVLIPLSLLVVEIGSGRGLRMFGVLDQVLIGGWDIDLIINYITDWRFKTLYPFGRTTYDIPLDPSSLYTLILSGIKIYGYYLFSGFSWRFDKLVDAYAAVEAILRVTLIYFSVLGWWKAVGLQKRLLGLMLILYISMSFVWAVGTTNIGTAMRHHLLTWWIIVILGVPSLIVKLQHVWLGIVRRPGLISQDVTRLKT